WGAGFYTVVVYGLLVTSLVRNRLPRSVQLYLLVPALYFTAVHAASVGSPRYRIPDEPPMLIVAASVFARRSRAERSSEPAVQQMRDGSPREKHREPSAEAHDPDR